jgi:hypothetical protein
MDLTLQGAKSFPCFRVETNSSYSLFSVIYFGTEVEKRKQVGQGVQLELPQQK